MYVYTKIKHKTSSKNDQACTCIHEYIYTYTQFCVHKQDKRGCVHARSPSRSRQIQVVLNFKQNKKTTLRTNKPPHSRPLDLYTIDRHLRQMNETICAIFISKLHTQTHFFHRDRLSKNVCRILPSQTIQDSFHYHNERT